MPQNSAQVHPARLRPRSPVVYDPSPMLTHALRLALLAIPCALLAPSLRAAPAPSPLAGTPTRLATSEGNPYDLHRDLPYTGANGDRPMDLYLPIREGNTPRPALLIIHGGGWSGGDKADRRQVDFATFAVDQGYVAASINYTLTRPAGKPNPSDKRKGAWPTNIADCKSALRWLKAHRTTLGIDPGKIAVIGGSAGGHLSLLTGLSANSAELNRLGAYTDQDNSVACIIDFYGIPDVRRWGGASFIDTPLKQDPEAWALASPVTHLTKDSPPILIVHGTADAMVDIRLSDEFVAILKEKGARHEYVVIPEGKHSFALTPPQRDLRPVLRAFLGRWLGRES